MQRVKAHELRAKSEKEITDELLRQRKELSQLRFAKVSSQHQIKASKIRVGLNCLV